MHRIIIFLMFASLAFIAQGQNDTARVLFLGNSYTYGNNLPGIVQSLATSAGKTLIHDSSTPGGHTFEGHSMNATSLAKIRQGNWDYVVMQEQSQIPTIDFYRYNSMYPAAEVLRDSIEYYNPCANVVMFMTWGRRFGGQQCDNGPVHCSPVFVDFSHMQDSLESAYVELGENIGAYISPVGIAWKQVIEDSASIVLHTGDNSHPNYTGSYLAACVFHSVFWNESPEGLTFTGSLTPHRAAYLQEVASTTVFDYTNDWNIDVVDAVSAGFMHSVSNDSAFFTNQSTGPQPISYLWDFGDGNTSTEENPTHTYSGNQTYSVTLTTTYCNKSDTSTQDIVIYVPNGLTNEASAIQLFPNPVSQTIWIKGITGNSEIKITDANGKIVYESLHSADTSIDLSKMASGVYTLTSTNEESGITYQERFVKL